MAEADTAASGLFQRLAGMHRRPIELTIDGVVIEALEGDTVMSALLLQRRHLGRSDQTDSLPRAGLCLMGACQGCWIRLESGTPIRACTTLAKPGMRLIAESKQSRE